MRYNEVFARLNTLYNHCGTCTDLTSRGKPVNLSYDLDRFGRCYYQIKLSTEIRLLDSCATILSDKVIDTLLIFVRVLIRRLTQILEKEIERKNKSKRTKKSRKIQKS